MAVGFGLATAARRGPGPGLPHAETNTTEHAAAAKPHRARRARRLALGLHEARDACGGPAPSARGIPWRAPEVITVFPLLAAATGGPPCMRITACALGTADRKGSPPQLGRAPQLGSPPLVVG